MKIEDGGGAGIQATVSKAKRLNVSSKNAPRVFYISRDDSLAFSMSGSHSSATGAIVFYIKNEDPNRNFVVHKTLVGSVNTSLLQMYRVTGTPSGSEITPTNIKLSSSREALMSCYGGAAVTGLTESDLIANSRITANSSQVLSILSEALILGFGDSIAIKYTGSTGLVDISMVGYFEDPGNR